MGEVWKEIVLLSEIYKISSSGIVINPRTGKPISIGISNNGYPRVSIKRNKKTKNFSLHRLLLMAFVRLPKEGEECRHLDGNKLNYSLANLKWGTQSENMQDRIKHGKIPFQGVKNPASKLTEEKVLEIDFLILQNISKIEIAKKFGISTRTVRSIGTHSTWKYLWNKP
jgi:hypothetical protein